MKKRVFSAAVLMSLIASSGCTTVMSLSATRSNFNKIEIGMTKDQVISIMGQPYLREAYPSTEGGSIQVLYYQTEFDALTPVVLKESKVEGWGGEYLDKAAKLHIKQDVEIKQEVKLNNGSTTRPH